MPPRRRARAPSLPPVRPPRPRRGFAPAGHFVDRVTLVAFGIDTFIAAVDAVTAIVLINLVVVGPLIAAVRTGSRQTAAVAAYALLLGIAEGVPHGIFGTPDHIVRCTAIAVTGALAVWGAGLRVRREAAERRQAFLGEAGTLLSGSLDYDATLRMITEIAVPALAEGVRVDVGEEDGSVRRVAAGAEAHDDVRAAIDRVLAGGPPELHAAAAGEGGAQSLIVVPMTARGRTFGAMTLVASAGDRAFDDTDLETAEELARRSALAVDNARLYGQTSRIARALQDSLLPARIPSIPGLRVATRFLAAGEGVEVGGDFLDVFEASDGRWAVVIGDVMGKGPEAAAVTALARYTIRATAVTARRPSEVLRALNDALLRQLADEGRFCTAAIAYVTPDDGGGAGVTLASAGHPLPMRVAADGAVAPAGEHGMVLGIERTPPLPDSDLALGPGDKLVFFTDGVIEARHDGRMLGSAGLASVLEGCAGAPPAAIAARVQAAVTAEGPPRDDLAVLVLEALTRVGARARERSASSTA